MRLQGLKERGSALRELGKEKASALKQVSHYHHHHCHHHRHYHLQLINTTQRAQADGRLAQGMNWLERKTGLDLDGDGDVGVTNDHHNTAAASFSSSSSSSGASAKPRKQRSEDPSSALSSFSSDDKEKEDEEEHLVVTSLPESDDEEEEEEEEEEEDGQLGKKDSLRHVNPPAAAQTTDNKDDEDGEDEDEDEDERGGAAEATGSRARLSRLLTAIYTHHAPSKVERVGALLDEWEGEESDLLGKVCICILPPPNIALIMYLCVYCVLIA